VPRRLLNWFFAHARTGRARADALIERGLASEKRGDLRAAAGHFRAAVAAAPDYPTAHVNLGAVLEDLGDAEAAAHAYEAALALDSRHPYASYNLGKALLLRGEPARAEALLRAALGAKPDFAEAQVVLASILETRDETAGAEQALHSALAVRPDYALALRNLGMLLCKHQRWGDAVNTLRRAVAAEPSNADAQYWLGNACVRLSMPAAAEAAYRTAVGCRPDFAEAWCNLGNVLADRGLRDEAGRSLEEALRIRPDYADALVGMGNLYAGTGRLEVAADCYRRALVLDPHLADAQVNLGNVLKDQGLWREALRHYDAALALSPEAVEARWARAICHIPALREAQDALAAIRAGFAAELDGLERWFDGTRTEQGWKAVGVAQPFWLAYLEADNRELLQSYVRLCARLMAPWQAQHAPARAPRRGAGRVRVGVVSQFFRDHSVWNAIIKGWFQHLDRDRFELQAFCLDPYEDAETRFARARAAHFEQGHAGLRQWAAVILEAQPDVLIYPEIGMDPMSAKLASMRLAQVQAASWGHPETTGLPTIDVYLSAADLEPANAQAHYTERLVALPNLGCCVQPGTVEAAALDAGRWGADAGEPLLVCPGTPFKYAPEHDWVLAEIARRLGRCRMVFFEYRTRALSAALRTRLAAEFGRRGLEFERYAVFLPWQSRASFLGLLRAADVFLDTLGFSGFNTAQQAVECDLPIVTRDGRFLRGRLASGILKRIGVPELVATDEARYVDLAVKLAQDRDYRAGMRRRIAAGRPRLYEDSAPIRALEEFLAQTV
jgi:predicted O-linked N-acetylglucosamine transferase (SPINDLY family)